MVNQSIIKLLYSCPLIYNRCLSSMWSFLLVYVFFFQNCTSKCVQIKLLKHSGNGIQRYGNTFFLQQGDLCFQSFWHVCLSQSQHWEAPFRKQTPVELKAELMEIKKKRKKKRSTFCRHPQVYADRRQSQAVSFIKHKTGRVLATAVTTTNSGPPCSVTTSWLVNTSVKCDLLCYIKPLKCEGKGPAIERCLIVSTSQFSLKKKKRKFVEEAVKKGRKFQTH